VLGKSCENFSENFLSSRLRRVTGGFRNSVPLNRGEASFQRDCVRRYNKHNFEHLEAFLSIFKRHFKHQRNFEFTSAGS